VVDDSRTLPGTINELNGSEVRLHFARIAGLIDRPIADVSIDAETATGTPRAVTIQVRDRLGADWKARFLLRIVVGAAAFGGPSAGASITVTTGTLIKTHTAGQDVEVLTSASGTIVVDIGTAGNWHVMVSLPVRMQTLPVSVT